MLVSWKWLSRYVELTMPREELENRLSLSGLNHESTDAIDGQDFVIDLEVTSNRGDCLGHIGVAREIAVLYDQPLSIPAIHLPATGPAVETLISVTNELTDACPRYTARVISGVRVAASPAWLVRLLDAVGIKSINNVVDATNFVLMECGQPLHAFDLDKLAGQRIIVRAAHPGETMVAIDHHTYTLEPSMCVIADAEHAVAVAGVMGGAETEVDATTQRVLVESAIFTPLSVRRTARRLKLASPSSYRFERRVDPDRVDWASRRVCELILESGGGEVSSGVIDTAPQTPKRPPVTLAFSQVQRLLGIEIDRTDIVRILTALGCETIKRDSRAIELRSPSWRHDLTRDVDLIEEVARIHGYDKIPEDAPVPVIASAKRPFDLALEKIRGVMVAAGISEAMTPSVVTDKIDSMVSPWTTRAALTTQSSMLEGARTLRRSMLPSLLQSRGANWAAASVDADLFEIAHVYLPDENDTRLPVERYMIAMISGQDFFVIKGVIQTLAERLGIREKLDYEVMPLVGMDEAWSTKITVGRDELGYLGKIAPALMRPWKLPGQVVAAELSIDALLKHASLVPQQRSVSVFPSVVRDLNLIVDESVRWSSLEQAVREAVVEELSAVQYRETYRDPSKDGQDRKRILLTVELRRADATLTGGQADELIRRILERCEQAVGAKLLA